MTRLSLLTHRPAWSSRGTAGVQRWTSSQLALFDSPYRMTAFWGANGTGKSLAMAELCRRGLEGSLPWQRKSREGFVVLLAGNTWSQLGSTLRYFWSLVDRSWFRPGVRYEAGGMKGQRLQVFEIVSGPGKGGELRLGTFDAEGLAGPRADVVITDEPLPENVYNELWPRLFGRGGRLYQGFTPTMGTAANLDYLWSMVDDPAKPWAGEIQTELTLEAVTPRGGKWEIPWATQAEIEQFEAGLSAVQRDMRMGRVRRPQSATAYYSAWGPHLVRATPPEWFIRACDSPTPPRVGVGIDHGSKPGAERATLIAVHGLGIYAKVWVMDEYASEGRSEAADDAQGVLDMLGRQGMGVEHVDVWIGDRAHAGDWRGGKKANFYLQQAIAEKLGIDTRTRGWLERLPPPLRQIRVPWKRDKSVYEGADIVHRLMLRGPDHYAVSDACVHLDDDHRQWKGGKTEPAKDGCDSERYIIVPMVEGRRC